LVASRVSNRQTGGDIDGHPDPEPFTQQAVIEELLDALGYEDRLPKAKGKTAESDAATLKADYSIGLADVDVESRWLLIEAESLGKDLETPRTRPEPS